MIHFNTVSSSALKASNSSPDCDDSNEKCVKKIKMVAASNIGIELTYNALLYVNNIGLLSVYCIYYLSK